MKATLKTADSTRKDDFEMADRTLEGFLKEGRWYTRRRLFEWPVEHRKSTLNMTDRTLDGDLKDCRWYT